MTQSTTHRSSAGATGRLTPRIPARSIITGLAVLAVLATSAAGQLVPDRLYYGVDRTMPMTVTATGSDITIKLMNPSAQASDAEAEIASADALAGGVDLAALFPTLWQDKSREVMFAQLVVDGNPVGAPVVLDPMVSVDKATIVNPQTMQPVQPGQRGVPLFESQRSELAGRPYQVVFSGIRAYSSKDVVLETSEGDIRVRLRPDVAPNHAWNFRSLAQGGYYTDIIFHRIVPSFVVQVGDPTGVGSGGPGYQIDLERSDLAHDFGVLSMARTGDPDSGGSQIFLCLTRNATAQLDGSYTAFGESIDGADTIVKLGDTPVQGQKPIEPPVLKKAYLVDSAPFGTGPAPVRRPETQPATTDETTDPER